MNEIKTVILTPMRYEAPRIVRGRVSYQWTEGYLIRNPETGNDQYPPVPLDEAKRTAFRQFGEGITFEVMK